MLTPTLSDPNRAAELRRKAKHPETFGDTSFVPHDPTKGNSFTPDRPEGWTPTERLKGNPDLRPVEEVEEALVVELTEEQIYDAVLLAIPTLNKQDVSMWIGSGAPSVEGLEAVTGIVQVPAHIRDLAWEEHLRLQDED